MRSLLRLLALAGLALAAAAPAAESAPSGAWTFVSAPDLHPPRVEVLVRRPGLAPGYFLTTPQPSFAGAGQPSQGGPLLVDSRARPVWFRPTPGEPFDLQQESYRGRPVLIWFRGPLGPGRRGGRRASGEVVIYDEHYRRIAAIRARAPWMTDLHDAAITGGDIWITVIRLVQHRNLTPYRGPRDGAVLDVGLQEFDLKTGRLIRTWDALDPGRRPNVPLSASEQRASGAWDAYHLNSVQALPGGDLLVSMRNTWSVYLIDPVRHRIVWTLGGKHSDFRVAPAARFAWQHDARLVDPADRGRGRHLELTLFDDNSERGPAKGMILRLNTITRRAKLVHAYPHHPAYTAEFLGSMQLLPNGNALVDWGSPNGHVTEFSASGRQLLNLAWPGFGQSYRALFTDTWVGTPYYRPKGAVRGRTVYASWNGATEVARWEVLAGSSRANLTVAASRSRNGFETAIKLDRSYGSYEVRALASSGKVLGTSETFS